MNEEFIKPRPFEAYIRSQIKYEAIKKRLLERFEEEKDLKYLEAVNLINYALGVHAMHNSYARSVDVPRILKYLRDEEIYYVDKNLSFDKVNVTRKKIIDLIEEYEEEYRKEKKSGIGI